MIARAVLEIEGDSIALARVFVLRATVKDGFLTGRLPDPIGLKDQGRVAEFLGLLLAVDKEEGDAPEVVPLPAGRVTLCQDESPAASWATDLFPRLR